MPFCLALARSKNGNGEVLFYGTRMMIQHSWNLCGSSNTRARNGQPGAPRRHFQELGDLLHSIYVTSSPGLICGSRSLSYKRQPNMSDRHIEPPATTSLFPPHIGSAGLGDGFSNRGPYTPYLTSYKW